MIPSVLAPHEERVLIFAPFGSDGELAERILSERGIDTHACDSIPALCDALREGVGALLITEEAVWDAAVEDLIRFFDDQPSWSSIPIVIAANVDIDLYRRQRVLRWLHDYKVTFLSRPVVIVSLASTLRSALSARRRQYQVRDLMLNLHTELRLRDEFIATLSHELRNPLGAVRNAVQLMKMRQIDDPELAGCRDIIDRQSQDLGRLLDDLLDVARVTQGKISLKFENFDLRGLLQEIVEDQRSAGTTRCRVTLELPEDKLPVTGDRLRIKQVFLNLLQNADKFSKAGDDIGVRAWLADGEVAVSVRDRGIGIPRHMLDSVFHLFAQVADTGGDSERGLGIGLTVVQGLVRLHKGRVTVTSGGTGQGAEFTVFLPARRRAAATARRRRSGRAAAPAEDSSHPLSILVIEDDPDGGASLATLLRVDRHDVTVCPDGSSGLQMARAQPPDVIILDIGLPDCNGYDIARLLRAEAPFSHTLFIALTGYGSAEDKSRARDAGFDHHLTKPIDFPVLRSLLMRPVTAPQTPG